MPPIYHFTDTTNIKPIIEAGKVHCHRDAPTKVNIGNAAIKGNRELVHVGCGPGGAVSDYVPFYFAPRSPMLLSIKCGNVEGVDANQRRLVYLVSSTERVYDAGLACVFSDGNAATFGLTSFEADPARFDDHVDWSVMKLRQWQNTDSDPDRMRRRMAEFLVHDALPIELIEAVGVHDAGVKAAFDEAVGESWRLPVDVRREWYF